MPGHVIVAGHGHVCEQVVRILEPERTVLRANVTVLPDDPQDLGRVVLSAPVTLPGGQTLRILDQLTVTVTPAGNRVSPVIRPTCCDDHVWLAWSRSPLVVARSRLCPG